MDDEVPPLMLQVNKEKFWSDFDDEEDEEEWATYQRSFVKEEVIEEEMDWRGSFTFEDEFAGELIGLPEYEGVGEFDLEGDLAVLEILLYSEPTEVIDSGWKL
ncbi:hypothetical protein Hanom_Chr11g01014491 [Helianthus anomalus]